MCSEEMVGETSMIESVLRPVNPRQIAGMSGVGSAGLGTTVNGSQSDLRDDEDAELDIRNGNDLKRTALSATSSSSSSRRGGGHSSADSTRSTKSRN